MRAVKPIDIEQLGEVMDQAFSDNTEKTSISDIMRKCFVQPAAEINALAALLRIARKVDSDELYGNELHFIDEIILKRIHKLAHDCENNAGRLAYGDGTPEAEDFGLID